MLFVPQCRCGSKEEAACEHEGDERQTEEKEGMSLNGSTVAGGSLSRILVGLECRHDEDKKLSEVRRMVHCVCLGVGYGMEIFHSLELLKT